MHRPSRQLVTVFILGLIVVLVTYLGLHRYHWTREHQALTLEWSATVGRIAVASAGPDWRLPDSWLESVGLSEKQPDFSAADLPSDDGLVAVSALRLAAIAIIDVDGRVLSAQPAGFNPTPVIVQGWLDLASGGAAGAVTVSDATPFLGALAPNGPVSVLALPVATGARDGKHVIVITDISGFPGPDWLHVTDLAVPYFSAIFVVVIALVIVSQRIDGVIARQYRALVENERELSAKNLALEREMREREEAERELGESEERFRSAFESAAHGMTLNAPGGRFLRTNKPFLNILGYGADEIISFGLSDVLHPDDHEPCWERLTALRQGRIRSFTRDVRMLRASGEMLWVMLSVSVVRDPDGGVDYFVTQVLDINEQKQAVAALRESEERFRSLVEGTLQGMVIDIDGTLQFCNRAFVDMFGYASVEDILRLGEIGVLYVPSERETMMHLHRRGRAGDVPERFEVQGLRKDGRIICIEMLMRSITWLGMRAVQTTVTDITTRKETEQALRASEQRLANAQRIAGLGNWDLICATGELHWSDEASRIFGADADPESHDLEALLAYVHPADRNRVRVAIEAAAIDGNAINLEHRILRPDGFERHVHHQAEAIIDDLGAAVHVTGTLLDITDRKYAEDRVQDQFRFLQTLINAIPMPIFYKDALGIYTGCNTAFESFIGKPRNEILGRDVFQISPRDLAQRYYIADKELMDRAGKQVYEAEVQGGDGNRRSVIFHKAAISDVEGKVNGLVGAILDITDLKQAQEALQKSEELHRMFAADAAHELRTPLAIMRAQIDTLEDSDEVRNLRSDVDAMARLVEQLLAATRLDFLAIGPDDRADISRVSTNVATYLAPIAFAANRSIEVVGAERPILVRGNSDALEQAVRNLVENAIKYSARNTTITIRVSDAPLIEVRDRGRGIPPELRQQIFQRFQRADRRSSGAGLGLSIVQRAAEAHGGSIEVADAPNGGSVFVIHLPPLTETAAV